MEVILQLVAFGLIFGILSIPKFIHDNRRCPPGKEIDWSKTNRDLALGISRQEYYKKYNSGYYDKDKD